MIRRRLVFHALGLAVGAPFAAFAQQQPKVFKIGFLAFSSANVSGQFVDAFADELRKFGYVEGQNVGIERRFADARLDRLPALAGELAQQNPDILVAGNTVTANALKQATSTIPIVFTTVGEPVGSGLVASLARPGGNLTGVGTLSIETAQKRLQLIREALPHVSRVAVFVGPDTPKPIVGQLQRGANSLGIELLLIEEQRPDDIELSSTLLRDWRATAMFVTDSGFNTSHRNRLVDFAATMRLPAMYPTIQFVEVGGLMCYGADYVAQFRSAASFVSRILKGAKPGDLPVEQATVFDLAINLKTAKALGIKFPQSVLLRATKVIE